MNTFGSKIQLDGFSIEGIDVTEINELVDWLSNNKIVDLNIAEKGMLLTLHGQNFCQDKIVKIDRWISIKEGEKNKAWTKAALEKATAANHKVVKSREWFAQSDPEYIDACNQVAIAKAAKRWFEDKASFFSSWHHSMKTFLKRDYSLERLGNFQVNSSITDNDKKDEWVESEENIWDE